MKVSCPSCQTNYNIDDKRIPPGGAKLKCARCQNTFPIKASDPVSEPVHTPAAIPLPGATASAAIPLPGATAPAAIPLPGPTARPPLHHDDPETTRVFSMPVPTEAYREPPRAPPAPPAAAAIPLPGAVGPADDFDINEEPVSGTPYDEGAFAGEAVPLPGASASYDEGGFSGEAIPLPGAAPSTDTTREYDYGANPYATAAAAAAPMDAVALPPPTSSDPFGEDPYAAASMDAVALPPPASSEDPYAADAGMGDAFALPPPPADEASFGASSEDPFAAGSAGDDAFALPPPAEEGAFAGASDAEDPFALPPPPAALIEEDPFALPPAPAADPFAADAGGEDPFALPPPPGDFGGAMSAAPSTVDVGMDFSDPPPAMPMDASGFDSAQASIPDALEFDPTAPSAGADDLEADLSAPPPPMPNAGAADGLEMLSFIDDAAKNNGGGKAKTNVRRFHVRRRSGKVFGPFEEGVVVKMLEDGQLLGNEDVSSDGEGWAPIGTVSAFATAIQKLMEGPGTPAVAAAAPAAPASETGAPSIAAQASSAANIERLNQLYGGRMAQVSVVDTTSRLEVFIGKVKKRLPLVISAAAAVAVLGVGLSFGATRYGVFGVKKFFPSHVKEGSSEAADVEAAHKALLQDSVQAYKQAAALFDQGARHE